MSIKFKIKQESRDISKFVFKMMPRKYCDIVQSLIILIVLLTGIGGHIGALWSSADFSRHKASGRQAQYDFRRKWNPCDKNYSKLFWKLQSVCIISE